MLGWLFGAYIAIVFLLIAGSGCIALCMSDANRRQDGYRVLRLLLLSAGAVSGILGLLAKLHAIGLFR